MLQAPASGCTGVHLVYFLFDFLLFQNMIGAGGEEGRRADWCSRRQHLAVQVCAYGCTLLINAVQHTTVHVIDSLGCTGVCEFTVHRE
jgi:hypothetical protein